MSAIFYSSSYIDEGHYINVCRERTSWIEIDYVKVIKKNSLEVLKIFPYYFYRKMFKYIKYK